MQDGVLSPSPTIIKPAVGGSVTLLQTLGKKNTQLLASLVIKCPITVCNVSALLNSTTAFTNSPKEGL